MKNVVGDLLHQYRHRILGDIFLKINRKKVEFISGNLKKKQKQVQIVEQNIVANERFFFHYTNRFLNFNVQDKPSCTGLSKDSSLTIAHIN